MTRFLLALVSVCALAPTAARAAAGHGDDKDDRIDSVVVFADRARVTRARSVRCEKGTARATFERLPAALDTRTLRGEVREAAEVIGLASEQVNERDAADPRARELTAELDRTETDIKSKQARKTAISAELDDVGAFGSVFSATLTEEIRNPKPNTPGWAKTLDALRARRAALAEERRKLDVAAARPAADRGQAPPPARAGRRRGPARLPDRRGHHRLPRAVAGDGDRLVRDRRRELAARVRRRRRAPRPRQDRPGGRPPDRGRADPPGDR